jgi:hypothetical protein
MQGTHISGSGLCAMLWRQFEPAPRHRDWRADDEMSVWPPHNHYRKEAW